jgi:PAS domain S-box-containing protein
MFNFCRNRTAENLYGYSAAEALGQDAIVLLIDPQSFALANNIVQRVRMGESWTGQIPVKKKTGDKFLAVTTSTPLYDDDGTLVGIICVSTDWRPFQEMRDSLSGVKHSEPDSSVSRPRTGVTITNKLGLASKISNLVSLLVFFMFLWFIMMSHILNVKLPKQASKVSNKVKSRIRTGENNTDREGGSGDSHHSDHGWSDAVLSDHREDATSSGASTPRGDITPSPFGVFSHREEKSPGKASRDSGDESEGRPAIHKIITSKAEAWIGKKGMSWPWKGNERGGSEARTARFAWPWLHNDQENEPVHQKSPSFGPKPESQASESNRPGNNEAPGSWSSFNVNSTSSASSCGSTSSSAVNKVDVDSDCLDYEILWEDLTIGEQIGQGNHLISEQHVLWSMDSPFVFIYCNCS